MLKIPVPVLISCPECGKNGRHEIETAKRQKVSKVTETTCYYCNCEFKVEIKWAVVTKR